MNEDGRKQFFEVIGKEFILFSLTFTGLMNAINSCFTGKSFHSVISFISDLGSFDNRFHVDFHIVDCSSQLCSVETKEL